MANPTNPPVAQFPISPPNGSLAIVGADGRPTMYFFQLLQDMYAAIQGTGGILDLGTLQAFEAETDTGISDTAIAQAGFMQASQASDLDVPQDRVSDQSLLAALALGDVTDPGITSVTGANGVSSTTTGGNVTVSLAAISSPRIQSNISGVAQRPTGNTLTAILDAIIGSTRGMLLVRGATTWQALPLGGAGTKLSSNGTDAVWL